ncbi:MAG: hypothetical protein WAV20_12115 [Blastocatellia bacterium]
MLARRSIAALSVVLCISILSYGQGNTFKRIRYQGGSVATTVKPDDWDNTLTVTSEEITLKLKDGKTQKVDPKRVTGLSYGQEAHRRVGTMIALAVLVAPLALFGLFHKTRKHYIGMEWQDEGDKKGGVLMQADKDNYRGVLMALRGVTGAPVAVSDDERKYVPTGIETVTPKTSNKEKEKAKQ